MRLYSPIVVRRLASPRWAILIGPLVLCRWPDGIWEATWHRGKWFHRWR